MLEDNSTEAVVFSKPPRKPRPSEIAAKAAKLAAKGKVLSPSARKAIRKVNTKRKTAAKTNGTAKTVGRPFLYPDMTLVRMPKGTLKRVHAACKADEGQGSFMRTAVMTELKRRRK